ncbi:aspartate aminotransferase family protein [Pseudomonas syringae]|uniref:aspartate aminotransferase family protein n=1 Tax=Pseudomonas syringae TaxID=317 RepID=UPI003F82E764
MDGPFSSKLRNDYASLIFKTEAADSPTIAHGIGSRFFDHDNFEFIDFGAALACLPFGFSDPLTAEIIRSQAVKLIHSGSEAVNEESVRLASALGKLKPGFSFFFSSSGAEANEAALKLARKYTANSPTKKNIIAMKNSFHGRTMMNISISGNSAHTSGYEPLVEGVRQVEFNNVESLSQCVDDDTCAIVVEVVQGKGGGLEITQGFVKALNFFREKFGCLIVVDDIQTGIGRLGTFFGFESYGLEPDIFTLAKGLGGGLPIGLTVARQDIARVMSEGTHGNTFGGNPLIAAVASSVVHRASEAEFLSMVAISEAHIRTELKNINDGLDFFKAIRGRGLMLTLELGSRWKNQSERIRKAALREGLLIRTAGENRLRLTPPLNISIRDISQGLMRLKTAIEKTG